MHTYAQVIKRTNHAWMCKKTYVVYASSKHKNSKGL